MNEKTDHKLMDVLGDEWEEPMPMDDVNVQPSCPCPHCYKPSPHPETESPAALLEKRIAEITPALYAAADAVMAARKLLDRLNPTGAPVGDPVAPVPPSQWTEQAKLLSLWLTDDPDSLAEDERKTEGK